MWYPAKVSQPVGVEPITPPLAKAQCRIGPDDTDFDADLLRLAVAVRIHVEKYCGVRIGAQTIIAKCDGFADFARLPVAPVNSVSSVEYVDVAGIIQTLPGTVYELLDDDFEPVIALKSGQSWPACQRGSRITVTAVAGFVVVPEDILQAMLMLLAHWFAVRETVNVGNIVTTVPMGFAELLSNNRRGV